MNYGNSSVGESSGTAQISYELYVDQNGNDPYDNEYGIDLYHETNKWKLSSNY